MGQPVKLSDERVDDVREGVPLSQLLSEIETAKGHKRLEDTLHKRPYPHYKPLPGRPDLICRIEEDGTETVGRLVGCEFKENGVDL